MSSITTETKEFAPSRSEGGITLLEAYSALASREAKRGPAVEIPFPGQPSGSDSESRFWRVMLRNVG